MPAEGDVLSHRYRLVRRIGTGPHGEVFEAEQIDLARRVAVKIVRSDLDRSRLAREAANAARLDARFVVPVLESRLDEEPPFVVSELARGRSLDAMLARPMAEGEAVRIALDALAHAHAKGLFHGDLRPSNIFVGPGGIQISDFGFAVDDTAEARSATDLLSSKAVVGYRAPERIRGGTPDARSDVFAVGVCLYEMIAGKRPFEAGAPVDEVAAILGKAPPPIRARCGPALARALAKDPTQRFASAGEMKEALGDRKLWPWALATAVAFPLALAVYAALTMARIERRIADDASAPSAEAPPIVATPSALSPALAQSLPHGDESAAPSPRPVRARPSHVTFRQSHGPLCDWTPDDLPRMSKMAHAFDDCVVRNAADTFIGEQFHLSFDYPTNSHGSLGGTPRTPAFDQCLRNAAVLMVSPHISMCPFTVTVE